MIAIAEFIATLFTALFAGTALYVALVEHPARLWCGVPVAAAEFRPSYRRGAVMQAPLSVLGCVFAVLAWLGGAGIPWLVGGVTLGAAVPFTLVVMLPTNKQLTDPTPDRTSEETLRLLHRWGSLHHVRVALGLIALIVFLWVLTQPV
jgi:Domain of unknown function (DUF1772)